MVRYRLHVVWLMAGLLAAPLAAVAAAEVGATAPDFEVQDSMGKTHRLSDERGHPVVLHFTDYDCPYVTKHHQGGSIRYLQQEVTSQGGSWLSIISDDDIDPAAVNATVASKGLRPSATLLDADGELAQLYGAQVAPSIFIVDGDGTLVFAGGMDDQPTTRAADIAGAKNFVRATLADLRGGYGVIQPTSRPYGCELDSSR